MPTMPDAYGRDLDLNLLRVFVVVAEEGSITRAAARLYVTQPAISAAMRRLTSYVGSPLFTRQGHGVVLTSRAADLLQAAKVHLEPLVAAAMAATPFDPLVSTATVRVGLGEELGPLLLSPLLALLRDEAPLLQVVVVPVQFRTVEEALISGRVDLAVSVADELPRSILREQLPLGGGRGELRLLA
jgi:LysR family transcriptional activator of mexEF-oprN operon